MRFLPYSLSVASIFDDYVCWERYCNLKLGRECHNIQSPHNGMYTKHQFYSDVSYYQLQKVMPNSSKLAMLRRSGIYDKILDSSSEY